MPNLAVYIHAHMRMKQNIIARTTSLYKYICIRQKIVGPIRVSVRIYKDKQNTHIHAMIRTYMQTCERKI